MEVEELIICWQTCEFIKEKNIPSASTYRVDGTRNELILGIYFQKSICLYLFNG